MLEMGKNYNEIRLKASIHQAVSESLADIAIAVTENRIEAYKNGLITADEMLEYLKSIGGRV